MLKNVVKTSFRFLSKNMVYTLINVLGLALGLSTSALIFLYVTDELNYDKFHSNYEDIYRVQEYYQWNDYTQFWATCDGSMAHRISENLEEGSYSCRVMSYFNPPFLYANAKSAESGQAIFADSTFFSVFSFPIVNRVQGELLNQSHQVLISKTISQKLFGDDDAVGKTLEADGEKFEISAVFANIPANSHLHFDAIFPMELLRESFPKLDSVGPMVFYTYVKNKDISAKERLQYVLQQDMNLEIEKVKNKSKDAHHEFNQLEAKVIFTPLQDIHLKSHAEKEYETNGNYEYILIYLTIAIFILILASINYVNLATASSVKRAQEVGVRKVMGANRKNVFLHFISEAFLLVLGSTVAALVIVELSFPFLNKFVGKSLSISMIWSGNFFWYLICTILALTVLSGLYPSIFMANFNPLRVLSNRLNARKNNLLNLILRRVLVVSQFSIAVFLAIASFNVGRQLSFIQEKDVGFDKERVMVIPFNGESGLKHLAELKEDYIKIPGVVSVTGSSNIPGERFGYYGIYLPELKYVNDSITDKHKAWLGVRMLCADKDFLSSFGFEMAEGRTFSADIESDSNAFILNEAAIRKYKIHNPIGKEVVFNYAVETPKHGKIIGIVKDFHYASFHSEVEPLVVQILPSFYRYVIIKIDKRDAKGIITKVEKKWHDLLPRTPFKYYFLGDAYEDIYSTDKRMGNIFYFFTFIALFLAGLGLYGLVAFISEQRKAEIGIRKILGASIGRLMFAMSKEFVVLILISNVIAWLPAWIFINIWLNGFAFRIELSIWSFIFTAVLSIAIGLVTISIKTWLAAKASPASILKYG